MIHTDKKKHNVAYTWNTTSDS